MSFSPRQSLLYRDGRIESEQKIKSLKNRSERVGHRFCLKKGKGGDRRDTYRCQRCCGHFPSNCVPLEFLTVSFFLRVVSFAFSPSLYIYSIYLFCLSVHPSRSSPSFLSFYSCLCCPVQCVSVCLSFRFCLFLSFSLAVSFSFSLLTSSFLSRYLYIYTSCIYPILSISLPLSCVWPRRR